MRYKNKLEINVILSSAIGTFMCWYDFIIFGIATALVFKTVFFPDHSFLIPMMVFAVGFLSRPVGSLVWGYLADRVGRKPVLIWTMALTGLSTVAIGFLPSYADVGIAATVILVALRILQTFALGGEFASASTILAEYNEHHPNRGLITGLTSITFVLALLTASFLFNVLAHQGTEWFMQTGWRIPFLFSAVLVMIGIFVRFKVMETPIFDRIKERAGQTNPIKTMFTQHARKLLLSIGAYQLSGAWMYGITVFGFAYIASNHGVPRSDILAQYNVVAAFMLAALIIYAWLGDRVGRINLIIVSSFISAVSTYTIFAWMEAGQILLPMILGLGVIMSLTFASAPAFFTEIYPDEVRVTASGMTLNIGTMLGGGILPIISQWIFENSNNITNVAHVFVLSSVISLICLLILRRDKRLISMASS